ncbi:MAG: serine hydrolase [Xanthobacteraceae bacterium]|uniref:serine hydrolase n=1 Tax=Pseudolabrys sp. TaxID=1960880 RepID=UPI003D09A61C
MLRAGRYLRLGAVGLAVMVAAVAVTTDPADARRRRHRAPAYNPPYAALVVDANTGAILHASNADAQRHPASLTKIMTLYLLFEQLESGKIKLTTDLEASSHSAAQAPSKLGLKPGETISVDTAIRAVVTKSANDVAVMIAEKIGGDEPSFARLMTRKAHAIGMKSTRYVNASGLPDDDQVTSARDQVLLGRAIQERFPKYYRYFSTRSFTFRGRTMRNHNKLLGSVVGVDGIKTGYIRASGFNLVSSVHRGERHIVAAVFGGRSGSSRDARMRELIASTMPKASTKHTAPPVIDRDGPDLPPKRPEPLVASAAPDAVVDAKPLAKPVVLPEPAPAARPEPSREPTASVRPLPPPGSTAPIKAITVKTVTVRPAQTASGGALGIPKMSPPAKGAKITTVTTVKTEPAPSTQPSHETTATARLALAADSQSLSAKPKGAWMIQIGAFDAETDAKQRLSLAQDKAGKILKDADPFTEKVEKGSKTLYRARFAGFTEKTQAEVACKHLRSGEIPCMLLKN